jgi:hypothetical protein
MSKLLEMDPSCRIDLPLILAHPFLMQYTIHLNQEITLRKIPLRGQKMKAEEVRKLVS